MTRIDRSRSTDLVGMTSSNPDPLLSNNQRDSSNRGIKEAKNEGRKNNYSLARVRSSRTTNRLPSTGFLSRSRSTRRKILPLALLGTSATNSTSTNHLSRTLRARTNSKIWRPTSTSPSISAGDPRASTTYALGFSPAYSSATAVTATSSTASCPSSRSSSSAGDTCTPLT